MSHRYTHTVECARLIGVCVYYTTKIAQLMKLKLSFRSIWAMYFYFTLFLKKKCLNQLCVTPIFGCKQTLHNFLSKCGQNTHPEGYAVSIYTHTFIFLVPVGEFAVGSVWPGWVIRTIDARHSTFFTLLYNFLAGYRSKTITNKCLFNFFWGLT